MDETAGSKKNIGMAVVAYIIFFIPLLTDAKKDPFVKFHVKQGLVLFFGYIVSWIVGMVPVLGGLVALLLNILLLVLFVIGILNAVGGKEKELPLIGQFADNFKF